MKVISYVGKRNRARYWLCECKCGNSKEIREDNLTSGATHSCGCKKKKQITQRNKENIKHGKRYTRVYRIWQTMKYRCYNPNSDEYQYYEKEEFVYVKNGMMISPNFIIGQFVMDIKMI